MDVASLAGLLKETEEHHGAFEASAPPHDWADFYAAYLAAREDGQAPAEADATARRHVEKILGGGAGQV